jgi:predicted metal-binding membrane protein
MSDAVFEVVLRRDRLVVLVALATITALAWGDVLWLAADMDMGGMEMSGFRMIPAGVGLMTPAIAPWHWFEFVLVLLMWIVMMVGMMTPSAAPMILIYARVGRVGMQQGEPFAATGWFGAGYLLVWSAFSLAATTVQWALERTTLLDSGMASSSRVLGSIVLLATGVYQWSSLKQRCLSHCRAPLAFIQQQGGFRRDARGALLLGTKHGAYCLGCCWLLMALLFVGGVMNVLWIAAIAIFVLVEKVTPRGQLVARIAGLGFVVSGCWLLLGASRHFVQ